MPVTPLKVADILIWADDHRLRTGGWPSKESGVVSAAPSTTWLAVNAALRDGSRGLPGRSSLARLLAEHRSAGRPPLSVAQIVSWAEAHLVVTGALPDWTSPAPVLDAPGETWGGIAAALRVGRRGLPKNGSLRTLLARHLSGHNHTKLTVEQIVAWAYDHYASWGKWPHRYSGPVGGVPGETWAAVNSALLHGLRGLPAKSSLSRIIRQRCVLRLRRTGEPPPLQTHPGSSHDVNKESA